MKQKIYAQCNKCFHEWGDTSYWTELALYSHERVCGGKVSVWIDINS